MTHSLGVVERKQDLVEAVVALPLRFRGRRSRSGEVIGGQERMKEISQGQIMVSEGQIW